MEGFLENLLHTLIPKPEKKRNGSSARLGVRERVENGVRVQVPDPAPVPILIRAQACVRARGRVRARLRVQVHERSAWLGVRGSVENGV